MGAVLTRAAPSHHGEASTRIAHPQASLPITCCTSRQQNWPFWPPSRPSVSCETGWETGVSPGEWPLGDVLLNAHVLLGELSKWGLGTNVQTPHRICGLLPRLLDISPASSLSFVLDTTGSMGEEINAAKIQARHIVEQRRGSPMEPVHYILVPFHDPGNCGLARIAEGRKV